MTIDLPEPLLLHESTPYCVTVLIDCRNAEYPSYCLSAREKVRNVVFTFVDAYTLPALPAGKPNFETFLSPGFITGLAFTL